MQGFLRIKGVMELTGLGRSTIYLMISQGRFPPQVKLSARCVGWYLKSLQIWISDRLREARASQSERGEVDGIRQTNACWQLQIAGGPCGGRELWKSLDG